MSSTSELSRPTQVPPAAPVRAARPSTTPPAAAAPARPTPLTARFRGDLGTEQWWWSPELFELHGMPNGSVQPTVGLLLAHVHDGDRPGLQEALREAATTAVSFTREYRVLRVDGRPLTVLLVCEPETDATGAVTALTGLLVDVTAGRAPAPAEEQVRHLETEVEQLRSAMASRAAIEQAKGILMLLMSCGDQVAFDLLAHISSHTHRKVRDVAVSIIESASGRSSLPDDVREILHDACPPGRAVG
jgi:hypothetical protein